MGKYRLVASHYDKYRKEFLNEVIINIEGLDLTKLESIDHFTSDKTTYEIISLVKDENNLTNQNCLSIAYYKTVDSMPIYYKVITNNSIIHELSSKTDTQRIGNKQHSYATCVLPTENYYNEFKNIEKMLNERNIKELVLKLGENHQLVHLCKNYLNCDINDYEGLNDCLLEINQEFSRYKTLRSWIVNKDKKQEVSIAKPTVKKEKIEVKSIEKYESDFEKDFEQKNNISYDKYQLNYYNTKYIDDDKEEFIEADELKEMGYHK